MQFLRTLSRGAIRSAFLKGLMAGGIIVAKKEEVSALGRRERETKGQVCSSYHNSLLTRFFLNPCVLIQPKSRPTETSRTH